MDNSQIKPDTNVGQWGVYSISWGGYNVDPAYDLNIFATGN